MSSQSQAFAIPLMPKIKQSQAAEIQRSSVAFANRIKELKGTPKPSEVHEVYTNANEISKMAIEELDFVLDVSVYLQKTPRDLRKITALYMLAATPLLAAGIVTFALLTSWRFHVGAAWAIMEACVMSLLLSVAFTAGAEHRKRQKASTAKDAGEEQKRTVQDYAQIVRTEAEKYEDAHVRKQMCEKPWLAAVALLVLDLAVCVAVGQFLLFIATLAACAVAVFGGSAMATYTAPRQMPENMTELEKFIAKMARAPILVYFAGILGIHAMPLVEVEVEPDTLLTNFEKKLQTAQENVAEAEEVRKDACRKLLQKTQFASDVEKLTTGNASERLASLNGLSSTTGEMSVAIAESASQLFGVEKGSSKSASVKEHAACVGDILGSFAGLAASVASPDDRHTLGSGVAAKRNVMQLAQGVHKLGALFGEKTADRSHESAISGTSSGLRSFGAQARDC